MSPFTADTVSSFRSGEPNPPCAEAGAGARAGAARVGAGQGEGVSRVPAYSELTVGVGYQASAILIRMNTDHGSVFYYGDTTCPIWKFDLPHEVVTFSSILYPYILIYIYIYIYIYYLFALYMMHKKSHSLHGITNIIYRPIFYI